METLDHKKRCKIIALLANGSSRRSAAKYVGCAASTITRAAMRDPEFADQLGAAEQSAEIDALRALRAAARKDRYWRAAAWFLERRNPHEFARRDSDTLTTDQIIQTMTQLIELFRDLIPEEKRDAAIETLDDMVDELFADAKKASSKRRFMPQTYHDFPDLEAEWDEAQREKEKALAEVSLDNQSAPDFPDQPVVQHPSSEWSEVAFPALDVNPETGSGSNVQS